MSPEQEALCQRIEALFAGKKHSETVIMLAILDQVEQQREALDRDAFRQWISRTFQHHEALLQRLQALYAT